MTPARCLIHHDPSNDSYGDCLRACVATVLDMDPLTVLHFADHGRTADAAMRELRRWSMSHGLMPYVVGFPPVPLDELLDQQRLINPDSVYILTGATADGTDHCVVCRGGAVVHNPSPGSRVVGPTSEGWWQVMVIARA